MSLLKRSEHVWAGPGRGFRNHQQTTMRIKCARAGLEQRRPLAGSGPVLIPTDRWMDAVGRTRTNEVRGQGWLSGLSLTSLAHHSPTEDRTIQGASDPKYCPAASGRARTAGDQSDAAPDVGVSSGEGRVDLPYRFYIL